MNTNQEILSYARGNLNGGAAVDLAAREYMKEHSETDYSAAVRTVIADARATVTWDKRDFTRMTRKFAAERGVSGGEAARAVAESNPRMRRIYEQDPMAASEILGVSPPPAVANITNPPWTPPVHESIAINQIVNIVFNLPRDEFGFITLGQAAEALRPYPDLLQRASADKMDFYARSEMSIMGLPGFVSEKYPIAFEGARRRFPSLAALYSSGRLSSQALRELLPQILITD